MGFRVLDLYSRAHRATAHEAIEEILLAVLVVAVAGEVLRPEEAGRHPGERAQHRLHPGVGGAARDTDTGLGFRA